MMRIKKVYNKNEITKIEFKTNRVIPIGEKVSVEIDDLSYEFNVTESVTDGNAFTYKAMYRYLPVHSKFDFRTLINLKVAVC